jgi:hypothetical protein
MHRRAFELVGGLLVLRRESLRPARSRQTGDRYDLDITLYRQRKVPHNHAPHYWHDQAHTDIRIELRSLDDGGLPIGRVAVKVALWNRQGVFRCKVAAVPV